MSERPLTCDIDSYKHARAHILTYILNFGSVQG